MSKSSWGLFFFLSFFKDRKREAGKMIEEIIFPNLTKVFPLNQLVCDFATPGLTDVVADAVKLPFHH